MIEVSVGEQNEVQTLEIESQGPQIFQIGIAAALKHAAFDEKAGAHRFDQETRPGNLARRAEKGDSHVFRRVVLFAGTLRPVLTSVNRKTERGF
jgi:hypothetical protein